MYVVKCRGGMYYCNQVSDEVWVSEPRLNGRKVIVIHSGDKVQVLIDSGKGYRETKKYVFCSERA